MEMTKGTRVREEQKNRGGKVYAHAVYQRPMGKGMAALLLQDSARGSSHTLAGLLNTTGQARTSNSHWLTWAGLFSGILSTTKGIYTNSVF